LVNTPGATPGACSSGAGGSSGHGLSDRRDRERAPVEHCRRRVRQV